MAIPWKYYNLKYNPRDGSDRTQIARELMAISSAHPNLPGDMAALGYRSILKTKQDVFRANILANIAASRRANASSGFQDALRRFETDNRNSQLANLRRNIEANRNALRGRNDLSWRRYAESEDTDENAIKRYRAMMARDRMIAERNKRTGFANIGRDAGQPANMRQVQSENQKTIMRGVSDAFGGRSKLLGIIKGLGLWYGTPQLINTLKYLAYRNVLSASDSVYSTHLGAVGSGATFDQIRSMGNAVRVFGGNEQDARQLYSTINDLTHGALVGKGLGPLGGAALRYGLDLTGKGRGGLATSEEIIDRIADLLKKYERDPGMQAQIAKDIGLSASMLTLLKDGSAAFHQKIQAQLGSISATRQTELKQLKESVTSLGVSWDTFTQNLMSSEFVKYWVDASKAVLDWLNTNEKEAESSIEKTDTRDWSREADWHESKRHKDRYDYLYRTGWTPEEFDKFSSQEKAGLYGGGTWLQRKQLDDSAKEYRQYHELRKTTDKLPGELNPFLSPLIRPEGNQTTNTVSPVINLDFGAINVTESAKQELVQIVTPWIEDNVLAPISRVA